MHCLQPAFKYVNKKKYGMTPYICNNVPEIMQNENGQLNLYGLTDCKFHGKNIFECRT